MKQNIFTASTLSIFLKCVFILSLTMLVSCAGIVPEDMPKQCHVSILDGVARYGSFTQYMKGEGTGVHIQEKGKGCEGKEITIQKHGATVTVQ